jgi:hypothetical protein
MQRAGNGDAYIFERIFNGRAISVPLSLWIQLGKHLKVWLHHMMLLTCILGFQSLWTALMRWSQR